MIEVVCSGPKIRDELARVCAETILHQEIEGERVVLRRYDLSPLLAPNDLTFDPEDGGRARGTLLRCESYETEGARTTLEINAAVRGQASGIMPKRNWATRIFKRPAISRPRQRS